MQLEPYLDTLRGELDRATALADEHTRATAVRLLDVLESPLRLVLIQTLSDAAAQVTAALPAGLVEVRMDGRDPVLTVVAAAPEATAPEASDPAPAEPGEGTARITLRLPEAVKARADAASEVLGVSLNTWITDACRAALRPSPTHDKHSARRVTGWA